MAFTGAIKLSDRDNVATSLEEIEPGTYVEIRQGAETNKVKALEKIPFGFKVAITDIARGSHIIKYGQSIGIASSDISRGNQVHIHNLEGTRGRGDLAKGGTK